MSASSTLHWAKRFLSRSHGSRHFAALPVRSEVVGKTMAMFPSHGLFPALGISSSCATAHFLLFRCQVAGLMTGLLLLICFFCGLSG